ncbi:MAG: BolA family transcriptional regulator [Silicimonas sp.]|nr:BolA family transcriptional regulator [Silicimonas sp.]
MAVAEEMREKLTLVLSPTRLEIRDDSESHRGHAGFQEGGESHFHITIASDQLTKLNRVARHRAIHSALGADLLGRIHALELKVEV